MDGVKSFFDSFKEFIWDIIGYLLPGSYLLILLSSVIQETYFYSSNLVSGTNNLFVFTFLVISYLLGYVIYGVGIFKENLFGKKSFKSKIESKISSNNMFLLCREVYEQRIKQIGVSTKGNTSVRELRTIIMGYIPEADQKIYTFTFRSELANHIGNISLIVGFLGLIFWAPQFFFDFLFFKSDLKYIILYLLLIVAFYFLRKTRDRFYDISMRIPFSIYMAKGNK